MGCDIPEIIDLTQNRKSTTFEEHSEDEEVQIICLKHNDVGIRKFSEDPHEQTEDNNILLVDLSSETDSGEKYLSDRFHEEECRNETIYEDRHRSENKISRNRREISRSSKKVTFNLVAQTLNETYSFPANRSQNYSYEIQLQPVGQSWEDENFIYLLNRSQNSGSVAQKKYQRAVYKECYPSLKRSRNNSFMDEYEPKGDRWGKKRCYFPSKRTQNRSNVAENEHKEDRWDAENCHSSSRRSWSRSYIAENELAGDRWGNEIYHSPFKISRNRYDNQGPESNRPKEDYLAPISSDNKGYKLLEKMGWEAGTGLGKSRSGLITPVKPTPKTNRRGGLGLPRYSHLTNSTLLSRCHNKIS